MSDDDRCIHVRRGRIELSKYWPDGKRFRRVFPSRTVARQMRACIEAAIALNTWRDLRVQLEEDPKEDLTFTQFKEVFLTHYRKKNKREDFAAEEMARFLPKIGSQRMKEFTRVDAVRLQSWRAESVAGPTVNRMMDVLSSMLSHAVDCGEIPSNPMHHFKSYPEEPRALRVMTIDEERAFVAALLRIDLTVGVYAGVMGETALRPSEADRLEWRCVDVDAGILTVDRTKGRRPRYIPMSDFCKALIGLLPRLAEDPHVFVRLETLKPLADVRAPFDKAHKATGLDWIHPEDFRHFRATQWVCRGVDPITVQELLGHADIHTTMRYAHFAPKHAARSIVEAQREEAGSLRQLMFGFQEDQNRNLEVGELEWLYAMQSRK